MTAPPDRDESTSAGLGRRLVEYARTATESLVATHLDSFAVPRVFAGHPVGPDVRADLAFTLGLLHANGVTHVDDTEVARAVATVLEPIDGARTHTFYSYRVAETLRRWGPVDHNSLLATMPDAARSDVLEACDSTDWIELLDTGLLPANYAAVLARCELARADLGMATDATVLDGLVERVAALLDRNPVGYLDDSPDGRGNRYDIYTADIYLFTEPLATRLGDVWDHGARGAVDLVSRVATRDGSAICWGRSTGALSACLTIELAALALERGLTDEPGRWLGLATNALDRIDVWFDGGLVTAHQYRSTYDYRGPERRLQMSLDCLGKLAYAALGLRHGDGGVPSWSTDAVFDDRDELIRFDPGAGAAVWAYRSRDLAFDLPVIGPTRSDYTAAPRNPGLFEVPVDAPLVTGVPFVVVGDVRYAGGGPATSIEHSAERVALTYDGYPEVDTSASQQRRLGGRRRTSVAVDGRTLVTREQLRFDEPPDSVSLQIAEAEGRPLIVEMEASSPFRCDRVDVSGLKEYRSFWGELPLVHQIDVDPRVDLTIDVRIRARLRVATNAMHHHYHRSLYDPMGDEVHETSMPAPLTGDASRARERLRHVDFFHLHWPEWFVAPDAGSATDFCDLLDRHDVRLVWTQHNLEPHLRDPRHHAVYQVFAERCDLAVHHSEWGRSRIEAEYTFGPHVTHLVAPHGHFARLMEDLGPDDRARGEAELGLDPCEIRVGVVGAPRIDKQTQRFMEAFARVDRADIQLVVLALDEADVVPDDARIAARPYEFADRTTYNRRLATLDVVALPFDPDGTMLTTGVVADVIGLGLPAIATTWGYLTETLGDAAIYYDGDATLEQLLATLDRDRLAVAAKGSAARRSDQSWDRAATLTLAAMEALGTRKL
jgi:hypothetical protein